MYVHVNECSILFVILHAILMVHMHTNYAALEVDWMHLHLPGLDVYA